MSKRDKPKVIDLFAGCGGLSLGLEMAGFEPIAFTEISADATKTYLHNRPHLPNLASTNGDQRHFVDTWDLAKNKGKALRSLMRRVKIRKEKLDLVVGGPPCQGYSRLGHRRSHDHDRKENPGNFLYKAMAQVIDVWRPRAFIFENVEGLLRATWQRGKGLPGEVFEDVLGEFESIGQEERRFGVGTSAYTIRWRLVHAYNYGVPQNRPRVIAIGIRHDVAKQLASTGDLLLQEALKTSLCPTLAEELQGFTGDGFHPESTGEHVPTPHQVLDDLVDDRYTDLRDMCKSEGDRTILRTTKYAHNPQCKYQESMRAVSIDAVKKLLSSGGDKGHCIHNHVYSFHRDQTVKRFEQIQRDGKAMGALKNKKFCQRVLGATGTNGTKWPDGKPNITVTSMPDDFVHYEQPRSLTVREWARLQTFPDWYEFKGKRTTGGERRAGRPGDGDFSRDVPQYTQIGNAVPPRLARAIGEHLLRALTNTVAT